MDTTREAIWFKDPMHFITLQNYNKFFPSADMSFSEQLNSLFRLSIYFSILVFVIRHDANIFFVAAFMGLFTFLLYSIDTQNKKSEQLTLEGNNLDKDKFTGEVCMKPSKDNPFMNVLMSDYSTKPDRPKACNMLNSQVKKQAKTAFDYGLYRDVGDIFSKNASDRQWITNPSTTIPNDRSKLTEWLYNIGPTCKEDGNSCYRLQYNKLLPT